MKRFILRKLIGEKPIPVTVRQSPQEAQTAPHSHDFMEIVMVRSGYGLQSIHSPREHSVLSSAFLKGDVFTVLPGEIHSYQQCHDFLIYNVCVDYGYLMALSDELPKLALFSEFIDRRRPFRISQFHLTPMEYLGVEGSMLQLIQALRLTTPSQMLAVRVSLLNLLLALFDNAGIGVKHDNALLDERLFASIAKMEQHSELNFNVKNAARSAAMSVSSYAHKFKAAVGVSPSQYHLALRLEHVKHQLLTTQSALNDIARENGFFDSNHLVRLFRKKYGTTPGHFRHLHTVK